MFRGQEDPDFRFGAGGLHTLWIDSSGVMVSREAGFDMAAQYNKNLTQYTQSVTVPAGAAEVRLRLLVYNFSGWVNFDDVEVKRSSATGTVERTTYLLNGVPIAQEVESSPSGPNDGLHYIYTDHLGSPSTITDSSGNVESVQRYYPFGEMRTDTGPDITSRGYTGHQENRGIGLTYMNARYYAPSANRLTSPDSIVPDPSNPQSFNRYSYVLNNPIRNNDPSGHVCYDTVNDAVTPGNCNGGSTPIVEPRGSWHPLDRARNGDKNKTTEVVFYENFVLPADTNFYKFGGPMTSSRCGSDYPGRPPCDARHPSVDSNSDNSNLGDPIYAVADGTVVKAGIPPAGAFDGQGAAGGYGHYVVIEHNIYGDKVYSVYAHNGEVFVREGDLVEAGDQIASMGSSGTTSVHLHFEVRRENNIDWDAQNPFQTQIYWPSSVSELNANFVDLGPVFGYHDSYAAWAEANP